MTMLEGKVALVTGAGRGLGWGVAKALGLAGAKVCATDVNETEMEASFKGIESDGAQLLNLRLDVADPEMFNNVVQKVAGEWGKLDLLIHTAAVMPLISLEETSHEAWWGEINIHIGGLFNGTKAVWNIMKAQGGGHIMAVASGASFRGFTKEVAYCVGKHGQEGFAKALALEATPHNIAINTMSPGKRIKPTGVTLVEAERMPEEVTSSWADPAELGKAFVWLAGQPPSSFTGLSFDAGRVVDTIAAEGWDFEFAPEKVTPNPEEMKSRLQWQALQVGGP